MTPMSGILRRSGADHRVASARRLFAEIDSWFTEGFDTKDWQEAKVLIEELGHSSSESR